MSDTTEMTSVTGHSIEGNVTETTVLTETTSILQTSVTSNPIENVTTDSSSVMMTATTESTVTSSQTSTDQDLSINLTSILVSDASTLPTKMTTVMTPTLETGMPTMHMIWGDIKSHHSLSITIASSHR